MKVLGARCQVPGVRGTLEYGRSLCTIACFDDEIPKAPATGATYSLRLLAAKAPE